MFSPHSIHDIPNPTRVGVIRGGATPEYELSLKTGAEILKRIQHGYEYDVHDILIDRAGVWHVDGKEINKRALRDHIDLAWIAVHGDGGDIQHFLEELQIPYLGSDPISAELVFNRGKLKQRLKDLGLDTPKEVYLHGMYTGTMSDEDRDSFVEEKAFEVFGRLPAPWVVKPVVFSARFHTYLAKTFPELVRALRIISMDIDDILIEEYIEGREFVSGVVPEFQNTDYFVLPPRELKHNQELFTHHAARTGDFSLVRSKDLSPKIKQHMEDLSHELHREFNLDDTGVFHFILSPKGLYVVSVQDNPEFHEHAPIFKGLEDEGMSADDFMFSRLARLLKRKK